MAQSKREVLRRGQNPDRVETDAAIPVETNTVPELLLQQHRIGLVRTVALRLSYRLMFLLLAACWMLVSQLSIIHLLGAVGLAVLLAFLWFAEKKSLGLYLRALEESLAERSGAEWEAIYIKARYQDSERRRRYQPLYYEPVVWAGFIVAFVILRFFFERKFGL